MANANQLTLSDRVSILKRRISNSFKTALVNDTPPGVTYKADRSAPTRTAIREFSSRYNLSELLPYEAYDEESRLYYNKDTVGFMLYANPATGLSPTQLKTLNGFFNQNHPPEATMQVSVISDPNIEPVLEKWAAEKRHYSDPEVAEIFETISRNRVAYLCEGKWESLFSDQPMLIRNYHLVISYSVPVEKGESAVDLPEDMVKRLGRIREAAMGTLRSSGMRSINMEPEPFINMMNGLINPDRARKDPIYYDDKDFISSQIVDQDTMALFDSGASSLVHKDEAFSILPFHVKQFPKQWAGYKNSSLIGSFTNNILRISCPFIATLTVNAPDQVAAKGKVSRKSLRATQMADSPLSKYVPQWHERKRDWDYTSRKIDNGNQLMEAFYEIVLFTPQGTEQQAEQSLKSAYGSLGWILSRSRYTPVHSLLGALPMGLCQETKRALKSFRYFNTWLSWNCTNVAPWVAEWKGTKTPMMLLTGRRGQLAYFDPFDNNKGNFNMAVTAASGAGKSFLIQEFLYCCLGKNGRAFIIDAGGSYKDICHLLKGTYIDFADRADIRLNPFSTIDDSDPDYFMEQLPLLKMLIGQMASPDVPLSSKQKAVLEKAIMSAWKKHKRKATVTKVVESLNSDDSDDGPMHRTAKDLAVMLHSFSKDGMYGGYFEGETNINLNHPLVVLELDALNAMPDLQGVVLLFLMMRITQVMYLSGNKSQHKLCIIDEAWRLLGAGRSAEFIEEGYRVARKHGGSFTTITQKIGDYFTSETAKAAYMNSDFSIYMRQKPEELQSAEANGHIDNSDGKVDLLRSLETIQGQYGELAISSPDGLAVCRLIVDPVAEKLYSTKAEEVEFIQQAQKQGIHVFDAIQELIKRSDKR